jgi:hypothetical protein
MKKIGFPLLIILLLFEQTLAAQENAGKKQKNILEVLAAEDSMTHATVKVHQDKRIDSILVARKSGFGWHGQLSVSGYRVQVFSSNVQPTNRTEAFQKEKLIKEKFPDLSVYVNYLSPFWKVRVGDFRTPDQAQALRNQLIEAFPSMRSEIYIVREKITNPASK